MIKPLADFVLIKPDKGGDETTTTTGIIIAGLEEKKPQYGEVVAIGPGKEFSDGTRGDMEVKPGDRVAFEKYGGDEVEDEGITYIILNQPRIFCKYGNEKDNKSK